MKWGIITVLIFLKSFNLKPLKKNFKRIFLLQSISNDFQYNNFRALVVAIWLSYDSR